MTLIETLRATGSELDADAADTLEDAAVVTQALHSNMKRVSDELHRLRVSVARLAQAMEVGHLIPKPTSEATGDEFTVDMQEAPYEILCMAAITDRGWNALVGEMVERHLRNQPNPLAE